MLMAHEEQLKMEANKPSAEELATMRMDALLKIWDDFKEAEMRRFRGKFTSTTTFWLTLV